MFQTTRPSVHLDHCTRARVCVSLATHNQAVTRLGNGHSSTRISLRGQHPGGCCVCTRDKFYDDLRSRQSSAAPPDDLSLNVKPNLTPRSSVSNVCVYVCIISQMQLGCDPTWQRAFFHSYITAWATPGGCCVCMSLVTKPRCDPGSIVDNPQITYPADLCVPLVAYN